MQAYIVLLSLLFRGLKGKATCSKIIWWDHVYPKIGDYMLLAQLRSSSGQLKLQNQKSMHASSQLPTV